MLRCSGVKSDIFMINLGLTFKSKLRLVQWAVSERINTQCTLITAVFKSVGQKKYFGLFNLFSYAFLIVSVCTIAAGDTFNVMWIFCFYLQSLYLCVCAFGSRCKDPVMWEKIIFISVHKWKSTLALHGNKICREAIRVFCFVVLFFAQWFRAYAFWAS